MKLKDWIIVVLLAGTVGGGLYYVFSPYEQCMRTQKDHFTEIGKKLTTKEVKQYAQHRCNQQIYGGQQ